MADDRGDITEQTVDKKYADALMVPRRVPQSLHEARVINSSVRVEPGRYRVFSPPPFVAGPIHQQPCTSRYVCNDNRPRRPVKAVGDGQLLGKHVLPEIPFAKIMEMMPPKPRKRLYFNDDDDDLVDEISSPKKMVRVIKRYGQFKKFDDPVSKDDEHLMDMVGDPIDGDLEKMNNLVEHQVAGDFADDAVDVIEEEQDGMYLSGYGRSSVVVPRLHSLGIGNVAIVKQLRGENTYLKDQLDASFYRIKQLENLLLERNQRLKVLLSENVQLGVKLRKLTAEIGEEAARELLGQKRQHHK